MPGGSTKKMCPFCQGILFCAQKICSHCKEEQPQKQRLKKKVQQFDEKREEWVARRKKNHNIASIKDEAVFMLEKLHAIGYKPALLLAKDTKKKDNKCEVLTPRRTHTAYALDHLQKIGTMYECLCEDMDSANSLLAGTMLKALEPHQRVAAKMDPVENLEDRVCEKHDKVLEFFCKSDQMCICATCLEVDHKTHGTVRLEEEYGKRMNQLWKIKDEIKFMIKTRCRKIQEIKSSAQVGKREAEKEIVDSVEVITALVASLERSQAELIEVIEEKQRTSEKRAEGFIKELEQEIAELQQRSTDLEQLSYTEDRLHLLHSFPSFSTPPRTRDWSGISVRRHPSVGTVRRAVAQLEEMLNKEMEKVFREVMLLDGQVDGDAEPTRPIKTDENLPEDEWRCMSGSSMPWM